MSLDVSFLRYFNLTTTSERLLSVALADLRLYIFMLPFVMSTYIHLLTLSIIVLASDRLCLLSLLAVADTNCEIVVIDLYKSSRIIHSIQLIHRLIYIRFIQQCVGGPSSDN